MLLVLAMAHELSEGWSSFDGLLAQEKGAEYAILRSLSGRLALLDSRPGIYLLQQYDAVIEPRPRCGYRGTVRSAGVKKGQSLKVSGTGSASPGLLPETARAYPRRRREGAAILPRPDHRPPR